MMNFGHPSRDSSLKVLHICYSDLDGGAARAAYRIHQAQRKAGFDSHMLVANKQSDDPCVHTVNRWRRFRMRVAAWLGRKVLGLQQDGNPVLHSLNLFPSGLLREISALKPDVVNLHWIGGEMLSIGEVAAIRQNLVWTLHDMWAFCGTEHYESLKNPGRYLQGYSRVSRPSDEQGLDINRWIYRRKQRLWRRLQVTLVCPSNWMAECARRSPMFARQRIEVIPNCLDQTVYKPLNKAFCRQALNLPQDRYLLLFGAMSATSDPRKGYHLLRDALATLKAEGKTEQLALVVFGASRGQTEAETGIPTYYLGQLKDDYSLVLAYNAADLFVAPSLQDNLPNTLVESLACHVERLAFALGGMSDLFYKTKGLVGLSELAESILLLRNLGNHCQEDHVKIKMFLAKFDERSVSNEYKRVYVNERW